MESFTNKRALAAYKARDCIEKVIKHLEKAQGLGIADMMGGMILISKSKYEELDQANMEEKKFEKYFKEMIDNQAFEPDNNKLRVEIADAVKVLDIFFDNLATDIYVQNKIENALLEAKSIKEKMEEIIVRL